MNEEPGSGRMESDNEIGDSVPSSFLPSLTCLLTAYHCRSLSFISLPSLYIPHSVRFTRLRRPAGREVNRTSG